MATITQNLQTIKSSCNDIKQAIIDKGGQVGDLTTYAAAIADLPSDGDGDSSQLNFDGVPEDFSIVSSNRIQKIIVKKGVTMLGDLTMGYSAFDSSWEFSEIEIPNTVEDICQTGFNYCSCLTHVTLPNSVKRIWPYAFQGSALESIIMPNALESISAEYSLDTNSYLRFCYFNNAQFIPVLQDYWYPATFNDFTWFVPKDTKIIVPDNLYDAWRNADGWSYIAEQIYKASEYPLPTK